MKLLFFLLLTSIVLADAPERVNGLIYRVRTTGAPTSQLLTYSAVLLRDDGTYVELYHVSWALRSTPQWSYQALSSGTYTYRKTGPTTATMNGANLVFDSDFGGRIVPSSPSAEFQFSDPKIANPLINLSSRLYIPAGKSAIVGFVTGGPMRSVLVRAVGPGLAAFGVAGYLKDPRITVFDPSAPPKEQQANDDWEQGGSATSIARVQSLVGAFPLAPNSKDASLVVPLEGTSALSSILIDSSDASDSGEVLVEVFLIP